MALPTLICLKSASNNKYLRYKHENNHTEGLIQSIGDDATDPYAQFEVEKSKTGNRLVHLKSRFNNKYLVRWSPDHDWIVASAYAADENRSSWRCTLFQPEFVDENSNIRLLHIQLNRYVHILPHKEPLFDSCLSAEPNDNTDQNLITFNVVDWDSLFRLPKRVAFRGNYGYLGASQMQNGQPGFSFTFGDPNDSKVAQRIFPNPDGTVYIKSKRYGKFWGIGADGWIVPTEGDPLKGQDGDTSLMFRICALANKRVALLNMKNTLLCKGVTIGSDKQFLRSATDVGDPFTWLEVIDLDN